MEVNNYLTPLVGEIRGVGTLVDDNLTGHGTRSGSLRPVERRLSDFGRLYASLQPIRNDLFALLPAHRLQTHRAALHSAEH
jgi:hypothetical protein